MAETVWAPGRNSRGKDPVVPPRDTLLKRSRYRTHGRACIQLNCRCDAAKAILEARAVRDVDVHVNPAPRPLPARTKPSLKRETDTWPGKP